MSLTLRLLLVVITCLLGLSHAADNRNLTIQQGSAGKRVALVIGNGDYQYPENLPKLKNPPNDAHDVADALRGFGFEVIERKNQSLEAMNQTIAEFGSKIGGSEAAFFYFAGHGIQVKNQNYLMPVSAKIESEAVVPYQGVNLNQVLDEMDNGNSAVNIVMLDACRNNPISGKFRSARSRGLAVPGVAPKGTVIVYATDPGNVASDGDGRNGLFTAGLLTAFKGRDLTLDGVLTAASEYVEQKSVENDPTQKQTPYINGPKTVQKNFNFRITGETLIASTHVVTVIPQKIKPSVSRVEQQPAIKTPTGVLAGIPITSALVVGNGKYKNLSALDNPGNDAVAVATSLKLKGIPVTLKLDLGLETLAREVANFKKNANKEGMSLFFYAGHGWNIGGRNYIFPVDAPNENALLSGKGLNNVLRVESIYKDAKGKMLVMLDTHGDPVDVPDDIVLTFSGSPKNPTLDYYDMEDGSRSQNSPYTASVIEMLSLEEESIPTAFLKLAQRVGKKTKGKQIPWVSTSIVGTTGWSRGGAGD